MHDEAGFLSAIRQTPADDTARLVFADWLDEQDDPACKTKAAFIRIELQMANEPEVDYAALAGRLQRLAAVVDPDWLALVSRPKVEGCLVWLERECPAIWSRLVPTRDPDVRTCGSCQKAVHYARTFDAAENYARRGLCTAVALAVVHPPTGFAVWRPRRLAVIGLERAALIERPRLSRSRDERDPDRRESAEAVDEPEQVRGPLAGNGPKPRPPRRRNGRGRNRNIQRDNWEDAE